ncbi:LAlv9 family protein [Magnaporthiopsis poae ATCC 64411]|uniref:LAlv9 family protein n=1 Tax=Magnaporthiopsis poae (strain ATCC 64411 / 73-15) TaxID=644358 RepID=A0A0C4DY96_MAGP6|nr:LAlv9 family protein [Magnaporthiopsis poae ATCC 64411]
MDAQAAAGVAGGDINGNGNGNANANTNGATTPGASSRRSSSSSSIRSDFVPLVSVVDFHHARGPEVEWWFGAADGFDPAVEYDWSLLPFMALSDGAHASTEDFSYFTLVRPATDTSPATSLFGISCTRQMDASQLKVRPADVTRSTVQKAVVVIADGPRSFGMLRERLSVVTKAWFAQREFTDVEILRRFQESLADEKARGMLSDGEDRDQYLGLSLRELVREFRWQTLVLFKCCLLQPKMLFFGSRCERLCMMQFSLISLIPGLLHRLQDCAGPELDSYEKSLTKPSGVKTSDRRSLLAYMGLPLQIFGKGSLYGPYTPLQQLDILADFGTKSYIVGSTNSLLLQQRDRYSDILVNLDDNTVSITSPSLKSALYLSSADKRWIESITAEVNETWDESNPGRPSTMGYRGSEESIRLQFEDYILSMLAAVKAHKWQVKHKDNPRMALTHLENDPSTDFNPDWVDGWMKTENFRIWDAHTDDSLFDIAEPKHPCASGLSRLAQQVQDLGLDERFAAAGVVVGRGVAAGREKASSLINRLYSDVEALREAQKKKAEEAALAAATAAARDKNGANGASNANNGVASPPPSARSSGHWPGAAPSTTTTTTTASPTTATAAAAAPVTAAPGIRMVGPATAASSASIDQIVSLADAAVSEPTPAPESAKEPESEDEDEVDDEQSPPAPSFPIVEMNNVWAEPDIPAPVGSKIVLLP